MIDYIYSLKNSPEIKDLYLRLKNKKDQEIITNELFNEFNSTFAFCRKISTLKIDLFRCNLINDDALKEFSNSLNHLKELKNLTINLNESKTINNIGINNMLS